MGRMTETKKEKTFDVSSVNGRPGRMLLVRQKRSGPCDGKGATPKKPANTNQGCPSGAPMLSFRVALMFGFEWGKTAKNLTRKSMKQMRVVGYQTKSPQS